MTYLLYSAGPSSHTLVMQVQFHRVFMPHAKIEHGMLYSGEKEVSFFGFCFAWKALNSKILNFSFNSGMVWLGHITFATHCSHNTSEFNLYLATILLLFILSKIAMPQPRNLLCWYCANTEQIGNLCPSEVTRQGQDKWNTWIHAEQTKGKLQWDNEVTLSAWQSSIFVYHPTHCLYLYMSLKEKNEVVTDVFNQLIGISSLWKIRKMGNFYWDILRKEIKTVDR